MSPASASFMMTGQAAQIESWIERAWKTPEASLAIVQEEEEQMQAQLTSLENLEMNPFLRRKRLVQIIRLRTVR